MKREKKMQEDCTFFTSRNKHDKRKDPLWDEKYPLSSKYKSEWVFENQMGPNVLWLTEWLCKALELKPGMRVLDMGCGKAMSSILLQMLRCLKLTAGSILASFGCLLEEDLHESVALTAAMADKNTNEKCKHTGHMESRSKWRRRNW